MRCRTNCGRKATPGRRRCRQCQERVTVRRAARYGALRRDLREGAGKPQPGRESALFNRLQLMAMLPEGCTNPLCKTMIDTSRSRGMRRRFCGKECRLIFWVLKRAARLLAPIEQGRRWEILSNLRNK